MEGSSLIASCLMNGIFRASASPVPSVSPASRTFVVLSPELSPPLSCRPGLRSRPASHLNLDKILLAPSSAPGPTALGILSVNELRLLDHLLLIF